MMELVISKEKVIDEENYVKKRKGEEMLILMTYNFLTANMKLRTMQPRPKKYIN